MALNLRKRTVIGRELEWAEVDQNWADIETEVAQKASATHTHSISQISGLNDALSTKMNASARGIANGVASLGADGKVPLSQLPEIATGSSGMFFPHDTLTQNDVGKLVIRKDGKVQLPVFEEATEGSPEQFSITCNITNFQTFKAPSLEIILDSLPVDGDYINLPVAHGNKSYVDYANLTFRDNPMSSTDIAIGVDVEETVINLYNVINPLQAGSPTFSTIIAATDKLVLTANSIGNYDEFNFIENYFHNIYTNSSVIHLDTEDTNASLRLGDLLKPFLLLWGFYQIDHGMINNDNKLDRFKWFFSSPEFSGLTILNDNDVTTMRYPLTLEEMLTGLCERLETLTNRDIVEASYIGNTVHLEVANGDFINLQLWGQDYILFNNSFNPPHSNGGYQPAIPRHCKHPVAGVVKSVTGSLCEIHTEPICQFRYSGTEPVSWEDTLDLVRIFVLDPDVPGYLVPITTFELSSLEAALRLVGPGYVSALDTTISDLFYGSFSLDLFILQILLGG